jgi:hypothetical protein
MKRWNVVSEQYCWYCCLQILEVSKGQLQKCLMMMKQWRQKDVNPLTPELNSSAERCLPRVFTGDFNF